MASLKICLGAPMADRFEREILAIVPDADLLRLDLDGSYDGDPTGVDVFCFSVDLAGDESVLLRSLEQLQAPTLQWVQAPGAGIEQPMWTEIMDRGVRLTNASGIHAEPIAQYIFTYVLHWERQVDTHRSQQLDHTWNTIYSDDLTTKTLGIVGFGGIGEATARVAKAFGMRVLGLRRSPSADGNVDRWFTPDGLPELLEQSDYVVLALPLTDATRRLIGAAELQSMGPEAVLINVARGGVVDQDALIQSLETKGIRGAVLDVVEPEPLAPESRLWDLENCIITPHDAGYSPVAGERLGRLFVENLASFVAGETMRNEIDPASPI